jgi:hypothetical protein
MKRILAIPGPAFAVSVLFLLVGVAALSIATRQPYPQAGKGSWHISKAAHMAEAESHEGCVTQAAELADEVEAETGPSPVNYVAHKESLPTALALIVQKHHFRSPPFLQ